jgi:nucleotide-binding universal stress UspA family protein
MRRAMIALKNDSDAERLTAVVAALAEPGGEVEVAHVLETGTGRGGAETRATVRRALERLREQGLTARGHVDLLAGPSVAARLARRARAGDAELVVVGCRRLGHMGGLFDRSVSRELLADLDLPVLVVPASASLPPHGFRRALLALGHEGETRPAVATIRLLRPPIEVLAVHVPRRVAVHAGQAGTRPFVEITETSAVVLAEVHRRLREAGIRAGTHTLPQGRGVAEAITGLAHEWGADLVVLGSRRLRTWEALIVGSTSHEVLQLSARPVLIAGRSPTAAAAC